MIFYDEESETVLMQDDDNPGRWQEVPMGGDRGESAIAAFFTPGSAIGIEDHNGAAPGLISRFLSWLRLG